MTREEAIEDIKVLVQDYVKCHGEADDALIVIDDVDVEALDMAIKALEQEPCENCISRKAAIIAITGCDGQSQRIIALDNLPSVHPARIHAKWITWEEVDNYIPSPKRHECSNCHDCAQVLVNGIELLSDFCPNCGAKMDLED